MLKKTCRTCWQERPENDFIRRDEGQVHNYKCKACRVREQAPAVDADRPGREASWLTGSALLATTLKAWNLVPSVPHCACHTCGRPTKFAGVVRCLACERDAVPVRQNSCARPSVEACQMSSAVQAAQTIEAARRKR
jgi:hypothetical protein